MKNKRIIFRISLIVCMALIFYFSSQNGETSATGSTGIANTLVDFLSRLFGNSLADSQKIAIAENLQFVVRKTAHILEYAVFGFLAICSVFLIKKHFNRILYVLIFCSCYAISDEFHQIFVPGRAARMEDFLVDFAGISIGILVGLLAKTHLKKRKTIFINAYSSLNLGDDIFVKILCERYPSSDLIIFSDKYSSSSFAAIKNLLVFPTDLLPLRAVNKLFMLTKLRADINSFIAFRIVAPSCNALVVIGGSMFIQSKSGEVSKLNIFRYKHLASKPIFILGANFGPYFDAEYLNMYTGIFSKVKDVCLRDKHSYKLFSKLPNARYAPDIVFNYKPAECRVEDISHENQVAISVIDLSWRPALKEFHEVYVAKLVEMINLLSSRGYKIVLLSFCAKEGDVKAINEIIERVDPAYSGSIGKSLYSGNISEIIEVMQTSKLIIATRFHSMILGWSLGKQVLPIVYDEKMLNVIKDVVAPGRYVPLSEIGELDVEQVCESFVNSAESGVGFDVAGIATKSAESFERLDAFLSKEAMDK